MNVADLIDKYRTICHDCPEWQSGCHDCIKTERARREDDYREAVADAERDEEGIQDER